MARIMIACFVSLRTLIGGERNVLCLAKAGNTTNADYRRNRGNRLG